MVKLNTSATQFEAYNDEQRLQAISQITKDWVHGELKYENGVWSVDLNGDLNFEEIEFTETIEDFLVRTKMKPIKEETYGAYCPTCYMDTAHFHSNSCCADCGTPE